MHAWEMRMALLRIQDEFDWPVRSTDFEVTSMWERSRARTQFFRVAGVGTDLDLVAKTAPHWDSHDVKHLYGATQDLAEVFKPMDIEGTAFIDPMGWSSSPPLLVMPYVESEQLSAVVRGNQGMEAIAGYLERAGEMIAAFHRAHPITEPGDAEAIRSDVLSVARRLPGGLNKANRLLADVGADRTAYLFSDTSLGNILLTTRGDLVMVDPPTTRLPGLVHRDLGNLLFDLRTKLAGRATARGPKIPGFGLLRAAFLDGYFGSLPGRGPSDERLIALYEFWRATGMTRKRISNRPMDAMWFARLALSSGARFLGYPK